MRYNSTDILGFDEDNCEYFCQTCFDEAISENSEKEEKLKATFKGKELSLKVKELRKLKKKDVKLTSIKQLLVAY